MRHSTLLAITFVFMMIPAIAEAGEGKAPITVLRFDDVAPVANCTETPGARANAGSQIREQFIHQLMGLNRFLIQEREIRPMKPIHTITGAVRRFDVCQFGKVQDVSIEIEVKMMSHNGVQRTFSSSAMASNSVKGRAPEQAIRAAVGEVIRRIDESVPRYRQARLPMKRDRRLADVDMRVKMYSKSDR
jgi:hypothetical protein